MFTPHRFVCTFGGSLGYSRERWRRHDAALFFPFSNFGSQSLQLTLASKRSELGKSPPVVSLSPLIFFSSPLFILIVCSLFCCWFSSQIKTRERGAFDLLRKTFSHPSADPPEGNITTEPHRRPACRNGPPETSTASRRRRVLSAARGRAAWRSCRRGPPRGVPSHGPLRTRPR